ncbi:MAG: acetamidase/formamidase family protein, partial [Bacillota bacterium]|nr:acetamidase/formamidase family protein [Bacillota bacterium]
MLRIDKTNLVYSMSPHNIPVIKVQSGATVTFETVDAFGGQVTTVNQPIRSLDWSRVNPATGPLYVEGAEPGDTLKVEIINIEVDAMGIMAAIPGAGLFADKVVHPEIKLVHLENGYGIFSEQIKLPLKPMIGVIGVAPAGEAVPCGVPGKHGGNMDNARITAGTTLYLPVFAPGALLAMGDLHAAMGDDEVMVTGVECGGKVTVLVDVIKGRQLSNPQHEDNDYFYTIASHGDLLTAIREAAADMQAIVVANLGLSTNEAGMLMSACGNAQICQVVDPKL